MNKYLASTLVLVCGCSNTSSGPPAAALPSKLDCTNILPEALRTKYLAGITVSDHPESIGSVGECSLKGSDGAHGTVNVSCPRSRPSTIAPSVDALKRTMTGATDLPGIGRGAVIAPNTLSTFITAWDDDSSCAAIVNLPKAIDATAFMKDLIAYLPPK